jgi:hypothetical protein
MKENVLVCFAIQYHNRYAVKRMNIHFRNSLPRSGYGIVDRYENSLPRSGYGIVAKQQYLNKLYKEHRF